MHTVATLLSILPFPQIDPVIVAIGPLKIHWYGLAYVAGILVGWRYARMLLATPRLWRRDTPPASLEAIDDFILWVAAGIVLGGRIGYVLFYDFAAVVENPLRALQIWNGGMSFHGGLLGTTLAMVLFARKRAIPMWSLFDIVAAVVPIGLFFGRLGNFINGELWGRITDVPWAMVFPTGGPFARHPSQLYEAGLEGIVLFIVLAVLIYRGRALKTPGLIAGVFVTGYGLARIVVENFREPDAQLGYLLGGWLTMGMLLSLPMVAAGLWAIWRARRAAALEGAR
ncbi:prolipoprotein diacylglyceryl transferase [Rhizobium rhizosphaerae]|uniref:Phosphatidylglycerol--prolipoprotein diacylglyceryl transferase n=1 Tax=Xaviernesmea rhizosphaerae TaxID=1672749 RepID=A0A1Q9AP07_9HYPH|nr:prolipoprotein diacylglyceryl transferase [Xaviernesmea rhizosphaerae]OLP57182.1 prolipoprotein diacylglyceryl transferase [Xaviernesmea rhizosphaerae]